MAEKNINARVQHKHDVEANWLKASSFVPKQGEIVVYDVDSTHTYERIKIGDGTTVVGSLPFVNDEIRQALTSGATKVSKAETADRATTADSATSAQTAQTAVSAQTADSATVADTALVANSATKATQDGNGKVIADTYETKTDAVSKLNEAKAYTEQEVGNIANAFEQVISMMYGEDLPEEGMFPSIRSIAEDAAPQADWNENDSASGEYIKNRTHWVERGNELKWNGNTEGLLQFFSGNHYKVSDIVLTPADLIGGKIYFSTDIQSPIFITAENIETQEVGTVECYIVRVDTEIGILIATEDYVNDMVTFEKGIYFAYTDSSTYVSKLVCVNDVFGQSKVYGIDPKFLPEGGFGYDDTKELLPESLCTFIEEMDMMHPLSSALGLQVGGSYTVTWNGTEYTCEGTTIDMDGVTCIAIGDANLFVTGEPSGEYPFLIFDIPAQMAAQIGIHAAVLGLDGSESAIVKIVRLGSIHTIDPKFLPKGGFGYEERGVLFDQTVELQDMNNGSGSCQVGGIGADLIDGQTYSVTVNGAEYECVAAALAPTVCKLEYSNEVGEVRIFIVTGTEGGEYFVYAEIYPYVESASIMIEGMVINTIDPKFIPEGIGGEAIFVRDSAAASGIALAQQAAPTATMNATEIMKAVNAGKTVYFLDENRADPSLLPFKEAYRVDELTTGIMPAASLPDPYVLFGRTDEYGFEGIKVSLTGEYWNIYADFSNDRNITDISTSGQLLTYTTGDGSTYSVKTQGAQSDWDQTDETAEDFIKNKPDEDDAFALLLEMNLIEPVTNEDGSIYTNENGAMYTIV